MTTMPSGAEMIARDCMARHHCIIEVLTYDMDKRTDMTPEQRQSVMERIQRHQDEAEAIQTALNIFKSEIE